MGLFSQKINGFPVEVVDNNRLKQDKGLCTRLAKLVELGLTASTAGSAYKDFISHLKPGKTAYLMDGDNPVAFMIYWKINNQAYEYGVMTHPNYRGRGINKALLQKGKRIMRGFKYRVGTTSNMKAYKAFVSAANTLITPNYRHVTGNHKWAGSGHKQMVNITGNNLKILKDIARAKGVSVKDNAIIPGYYPKGGLYDGNVNPLGFPIDSTTGDGLLMIALNN